MAKIQIHDLDVEDRGLLGETDLEEVVGGLTAQAPTTSYFSTSTYMSYSSLSMQQPLSVTRLPLLGGSLVSYPSLSGVRG